MCKRILVVEEAHSLADRVALLVERLGHEVRIARDGPAALLVGRHFHPQIVLLHDTVADIDGCPLATALRNALGKQARIISLPAADETSYLHERS